MSQMIAAVGLGIVYFVVYVLLAAVNNITLGFNNVAVIATGVAILISGATAAVGLTGVTFYLISITREESLVKLIGKSVVFLVLFGSALGMSGLVASIFHAQTPNIIINIAGFAILGCLVGYGGYSLDVHPTNNIFLAIGNFLVKDK